LEDLRAGTLGAAAGVFSVGVTLLIARIDSYYAYLSWLETTSDSQYYDRAEALWWIPFGVWHVVLAIVASLLVHRYLTARVRSRFLLWQVIGAAALLGWGLTFFAGLSIDCVMLKDLDPFARALNSLQVGNTAKYLSAAFACNVFYGSVIAASSRHYIERFDIETLIGPGDISS
jgi:hypothetical protein